MFEDILLNIILIMFPILCYFVYSCYVEVKNKKYNRIIFIMLLISSLYLCFKYGNVYENDKVLLFCNIPIIVAYLKKEGLFGVILSVFAILYCYFVFDYNVSIMIFKYLGYFICYLIALKKRISSDSFLAVIAVIQGFFISFEYFFKSGYDINLLVDLFIVVIIFYLVTFLALYLSKTADKITSLHVTIKKLEKEKVIMDSLFKLTHEIKNPIAVCKGYLDMLDLNDSKKVVKYIPIVRQEIDRSLNIMTDFMEFSKIKIEKEIIDVNLLLDDVYDSLNILIKDHNIKLKYIENEDEIYVMGDYNRLKQVIINLVKNSKEAIKDKGEIILEGKRIKNRFVIRIEDNGIGMSEEELSKVKDMFYTTKEKGSGIGVCLSNEIIEAHGGIMNYKSKVGKGTTVVIELPIK